uniref:Uncharacterized protein n=1 Tax=Arundo donax TaxID=35708 RepID=A0A0A8ZLC7_ARUDO
MQTFFQATNDLPLAFMSIPLHKQYFLALSMLSMTVACSLREHIA